MPKFKISAAKDVPAKPAPDSVMEDGEDSIEPNGDFDFGSEEEEDDDDEEVTDEEGAEGEDMDGENFQSFSEDGEGDEEDDDSSDSDGGVPLPQGRPLSPSRMPLINPVDDITILSTSAAATDADLASLNPQRPTPYVHDAGLLMVADPNPLPRATPATLEAVLAANARDAAQSLFNHLLTTCPIHSLPLATISSSGVVMSLPPPSFHLPREKKVPVPKPPTRWEQFAARKGIGLNGRKGGVGRDGELRSTEGKMVYDEASGEWVPKWGYKGKNKKGEGEWLVEVDEKKERRTGEADDERAASRAERKEKGRRNERLQRANERRARKGRPSS